MKKMIIVFLFSILVVGLGFVFTFKILKESDAKDSQFDNNTEVKSEIKDNEVRIKPYGYDMLDEYQQELYDYMDNRQLQYGEEHLFDKKEDYYYILKVVELYRKNNIELCDDYCYAVLQENLPGMHEEELPAIGIKTVRKLFYIDNWSEKRLETENKAKEIISRIPQNMSNIKKIQYLYDYVLNNVEYENLPVDRASSYDGLIRGKALCAGYAKTFEFLAQKAGFNVLTVSGQVGVDLNDHAWNMIEYDGKWYYLDPTWDDTENEYYDYFMLTEEELNKKRINKIREYSYEIPLPKTTASLADDIRVTVLQKNVY